MKRKTHQTLWELESIYYRTCRITGSKPDLESYQDLDSRQAIVALKRLIVRAITDI